MVAPCAASPAMSWPSGTGVRPACRVMITVCEMPGAVSSAGSAAAAATNELTPGTTAYVDAARVEGAHLLADRAVEARVAGVQAHDLLAGRVRLRHHLDLLAQGQAALSCSSQPSRVQREHGLGHQRAGVDDDVGLLEQAAAFDGDELGVARAGADEPDHVEASSSGRAGGGAP